MSDSTTRRYGIRLDVAVPRLRRRLMTRLLPFLGVCVVVGFFMAGRGSHSDESLLHQLLSLPTLVMAVTVLGSIWVTFRRSLKASLAELESYRLWLGERVLRRVVAGYAEAELSREQVSRLVHAPDGLLVEGAGRSVFVPSSLEGFDEVKQRLAGWRPAEAARPAWGKAVGLSLAAVAGTTGAWYAATHLEWPVARVAASAVLYGTLFALYWKVGRHPDVSRRLKMALLLMSIYLGIGPPVRLFQERVMPSLVRALPRTSESPGDGKRLEIEVQSREVIEIEGSAVELSVDG